MTSRFPLLALGLAGLVALAGCTPQSGLIEPRTSRDLGAIALVPKVASPPVLQAIVKEWRATDIHRIEIVPLLEIDAETALPLSKLTSEPTTMDDPDIVKVEMSGTELILERAIVLTGLRRHQTYRIVAHAYTESGNAISIPYGSTVTVRLDDDDRPTMPTVLPLALAPKDFSGRMPLVLWLTDPGNRVDHVQVKVFRKYDEYAFPDGSPLTIARADLALGLTLLGLRARTDYQVTVTAYEADPEAAALSETELSWRMEDDDEPATRSVTISVP